MAWHREKNRNVSGGENRAAQHDGFRGVLHRASAALRRVSIALLRKALVAAALFAVFCACALRRKRRGRT